MDEQPNEQQWERRHFLKTSALIGAGFALTGGHVVPLQAQGGVAAALYGDGGLTSIALADDCARLARHASGMESAFKDVLRRNVNEALPGNVALLGDMVRMNSEQAVGLLRGVRQDWPPQGDEDEQAIAQQKLALVLGWMMHQGARAHLGPLHREAELDVPGLYPSEMAIYQDAAVLRHRSARKEAAGNGQQVDAVARLFREMGPRMLIRIHTFVPDYDDGAGWINRLAGWRDEKEVHLRRLAGAYQDPDPDKLQRYVEAPNFYDDEDALIRVARALQEGKEPATSPAAAVEETTGEQSYYARALRQGYQHVEAASAYFGEGLGEQELMDRLSS